MSVRLRPGLPWYLASPMSPACNRNVCCETYDTVRGAVQRALCLVQQDILPRAKRMPTTARLLSRILQQLIICHQSWCMEASAAALCKTTCSGCIQVPLSSQLRSMGPLDALLRPALSKACARASIKKAGRPVLMLCTAFDVIGHTDHDSVLVVCLIMLPTIQ